MSHLEILAIQILIGGVEESQPTFATSHLSIMLTFWNYNFASYSISFSTPIKSARQTVSTQTDNYVHIIILKKINLLCWSVPGRKYDYKHRVERFRYSREPMFITKPRSTEAHEGDTVVIRCEVVGDPKPEVFWLRDFLKVMLCRQINIYKIKNIK